MVSIFMGSMVNHFFEGNGGNTKMDYSMGLIKISEEANYIADTIREDKVSVNNRHKIEQILKDSAFNQGYKAIISDSDGKILYKSDNASEAQIDIYATIKNVMNSSKDITIKDINSILDKNKEYVSFYPLNFTDKKGYVMVSGTPQGEIVYDREKNPVPQTIAVLVTFLLLFYFITNKKMRYIELVSDGLLEISKGNLNYRIKKYGDDELASLSNNINFMAEELKNKMEMERQAERTKSELITNVSHDLRTPLTSIKGYLGLIKEKKYLEEHQLEQYINIAYNKSEKLEVLINDLFEYTKLTSNGTNLNIQNIALNGLLEQLMDELVPISEENNITIEEQFINQRVMVKIDPIKTVRVFENLLMNAIRYSLKPGKIKVILIKDGDFAIVRVQNKCDDLSQKDLEKIFDRFYRVEKSRSSDTGGSGLGLAIAKNIVELQGGDIGAEYQDGYISFNVKFKLM
jgi:signal transduction histidine kinase